MGAAPPPPDTLALIALRLTAVAPAAEVAARLGVPESRAGAVLTELAGAGWARFRQGRLTGWSLTPAGRAEVQARMAAEIDAAGARAAVTDAYQRFLALNQPFLALCTDWQMRDVEARIHNDHTDAAYDAAVAARLGALRRRLVPVLDDLTSALARFGGYEARFDRALARVAAGDGDWFTRPTVDSFHTVWFELHEDLLATLGIHRSSEAAPG